MSTTIFQKETGIGIISGDIEMCRAMAKNPNFVTSNLFVSKRNGHIFEIGETRTLKGLQTCPEHNGKPVKIIDYREDGENGKAYYVEGEINECLNCVYESRLC